MGRTLKSHDDRRNEILDGAWGLFTTRGYEGTTVAAILDAVGIAKGTFYHYFESKEEVLDAVTDRMSAESREELGLVVEDSTLEAVPKLDRFFEVARRSRLRRVDAVIGTARVLYRDENLVIRHKILDRLARLMVPALRSIIDQGVEEGCFRVVDSVEAAFFVWQMSNTFADRQMRTLLGTGSIDDKVGELALRADFVADALERLLGAEPGSISKPNREFFEHFVRAAEQAGAGPGHDATPATVMGGR
jgi:AcrR family transcriptional regulator